MSPLMMLDEYKSVCLYKGQRQPNLICQHTNNTFALSNCAQVIRQSFPLKVCGEQIHSQLAFAVMLTIITMRLILGNCRSLVRFVNVVCYVAFHMFCCNMYLDI